MQAFVSHEVLGNIGEVFSGEFFTLRKNSNHFMISFYYKRG